MTLEEVAVAHRAWVDAEEAYRTESRRYFVISDQSEPLPSPEQLFDPKAAKQLSGLRGAASGCSRRVRASDRERLSLLPQRA
jgi:hypothetical protein